MVILWCVPALLAAVLASTWVTDACNLECALSRLNDLEQKQRVIIAENKELRTIISGQQTRIQFQTQRINGLEEKLLDAQHTTPSTASQARHDEEEGRRLKVGNTGRITPSRKRQARSGIAFSTYLDHDVETMQTVRFNKILTNEGTSYNNHTGMFTCPESGVYLLTFAIGERDANNGVYVELLINSVHMVDGAVDTMHASQDLQGGNTVIIRMKAGDVAWIEAKGRHVEGSESLRLSTFSGVFLYP